MLKFTSPLANKIRKNIVQAISEFQLIEQGDHILCAVSGGKDSTIMALLLKDIQTKSPVDFTFEAILLDQKQPGFCVTTYQKWLQNHDINLKVIHEDTYSIVQEKTQPGKSFCGLCSRLRRGILYNYAHEHKFNKIALGHHRDDANETLLMNAFLNGRLASMPPKLLSDDKRNLVIRPLALVSEMNLETFSLELGIPVIPCNLCGSQENMMRQKVKNLLQDLQKDFPSIQQSLMTAQKNINTSQLADTSLWNLSS